MSIDTITTALHGHKLHKVSGDRWRAICPVCGERNANTLSVGVSPTGAVLVKCFESECSVDSICAALGVDIADLFPPREARSGPLPRRRLISPAQALDLLHDEAQLIALCGSNIGHGVALSDDDRSRCLTAAGRIAVIRDEVMS